MVLVSVGTLVLLVSCSPGPPICSRSFICSLLYLLSSLFALFFTCSLLYLPTNLLKVVDAAGQTAIHVAASNGHYEMCQVGKILSGSSYQLLVEVAFSSQASDMFPPPGSSWTRSGRRGRRSGAVECLTLCSQGDQRYICGCKV